MCKQPPLKSLYTHSPDEKVVVEDVVFVVVVVLVVVMMEVGNGGPVSLGVGTFCCNNDVAAGASVEEMVSATDETVSRYRVVKGILDGNTMADGSTEVEEIVPVADKEAGRCVVAESKVVRGTGVEMTPASDEDPECCAVDDSEAVWGTEVEEITSLTADDVSR